MKEVKDILIEWGKAKYHYPDFHSMHEGYAVLLEEVHELWDIVKQKGSDRNKDEIIEECNQIAAVALRIKTDLIDSGKYKI